VRLSKRIYVIVYENLHFPESQGKGIWRNERLIVDGRLTAFQGRKLRGGSVMVKESTFDLEDESGKPHTLSIVVHYRDSLLWIVGASVAVDGQVLYADGKASA